MMVSNIALQYLARIWSTLSASLSESGKHHHMKLKPYDGVAAQPLTNEDRKHYATLARNEYNQRLKQRQAQQAAQRQVWPDTRQQMLPAVHQWMPSMAHQHALNMVQPQTRQLQASAASKRPATALESPESGVSTKRRHINASPAQPVVQLQPRSAAQQGAVGNLLDFQFPPPPNNYKAEPAKSISFDDHFGVEGTCNGQGYSNEFLPAVPSGPSNEPDPAKYEQSLDFNELFGDSGIAGEHGFPDLEIAPDAGADDGADFEPEAAVDEDEGNEYTE
jgi:hypothetical protein